MNTQPWTLAYTNRPEHLYVGPRRCGKTTIVTALREAGYWAHECTTETGDEIHRIYSAQRKLYEADRSAKNQPRIFFSDSQWWLYSPRFHYVPETSVGQITFPERVLEDQFSERCDIDTLYWICGDARERLIPDIAKSYFELLGENADSNRKASALRKAAAEYLTKNYADTLPALVWVVPQLERTARYTASLTIERHRFESRLRAYRSQGFALPDGCTSANFVDFLLACGICEYVRKYYLRFAFCYSAGLKDLKAYLTHRALKKMLTPGGEGETIST